MPLAESVCKESHEKRDILSSLPERWDGYGKDIDPVEKVLSESVFLNLFLKISIGGRS